MPEVVPIAEAKANLSKLVKRAQAGETIYLGAYGRAEAMIAPLPERRTINLGAGASRKVGGFDYGADQLIESDPEIAALFDAAINRGMA
jgi:antitoxin (DNA-binding transcriptional repressor) of toxin-antitoxin stability system